MAKKINLLFVLNSFTKITRIGRGHVTDKPETDVIRNVQ